jgi:cytochrome c553
MRIIPRLASALAIACVAPLAQAQSATPPELNLARNLAATCANCHGTNGQSVGGMAALAGVPKDSIVKNMKEFKEGKKPATIMHQLSKGYTDTQIELIADYLSKQKAK